MINLCLLLSISAFDCDFWDIEIEIFSSTLVSWPFGDVFHRPDWSKLYSISLLWTHLTISHQFLVTEILIDYHLSQLKHFFFINFLCLQTASFLGLEQERIWGKVFFLELLNWFPPSVFSGFNIFKVFFLKQAENFHFLQHSLDLWIKNTKLKRIKNPLNLRNFWTHL